MDAGAKPSHALRDAQTEPLVSNGSPSPDRSRRRQARKWTRGFQLLVLAILLALVATAGGTWFFSSNLRAARNDLVTYTVHKQQLLLTIVERGALESADNAEISCRVKARTQGSTVATTIKWVVEDGTPVRKGELLAELDDSGLVETLKTEKITLDQDKALFVAAEEQLKIVQSQNESDIKAKEITLDLAKIDLEKYIKGDYEQTKKTLLGNIKTSESDLEQYRDRAAWSARMVKKGYQTPSQAQADQSKLESAELKLANDREALRVLEDSAYGTFVRTVKANTSAVEQAKRDLLTTKAQALSKETTARSDMLSKKSIYEQELSRCKEIDDEIKKCKLYAPQDGLVVYFVSEQSRFGVGSQQGIIAQGEPVREGQKLMRIPDLHKMLVNTKVHEALISHIRGEVHDENGGLSYEGMPAQVKIDSYPDRVLRGHVKSVATVASQQDWFSADVKVYQTMVAIDEPLDGLRPGMSAEVTVLVDDTPEPVLAVPVEAVVGQVAAGKHREVFVLTAQGPKRRDIVVGLTNDKMVEVKSGLDEGNQVVLNPQSVLGEDESKVRAPTEDSEGQGRKDWRAKRFPAAADKASKAKGGQAKAVPAVKAAAEVARPDMNSEDMQKRQKEWLDKLRNATPKDRKQMLDQLPEQWREAAKQGAKAQGIEIPQ
jgi:multidrug resistance efflux pump